MDFDLSLPTGEETLEEVKKEVATIPETVQTAICSKVVGLADGIMELDLTLAQNKSNVTKTIDGFGAEPERRSAERSKLLSTNIKSLSAGGGEGSEVAKSLIELSSKCQELDPSLITTLKKSKIGMYFKRYERADKVIDGIIKNLEIGKQRLQQDSTSLQIEHDYLATDTKEIFQSIEMARQLDAELTKRKELCLDQDRVNFIEQEILFPLRQRIQDMQALAIVNQQAMVAMTLIIKNNRELINGVNRTKNVTIRALETAVMIAGALYNQKIVLNAINSTIEVTNNLIAGTASMLKQNTLDIQRQSSEAMLSIDTLKQAWSDMNETINAVNTYRREALPKLSSQIDQFQTMLDEGSKAIEDLNKGNIIAGQISGEN